MNKILRISLTARLRVIADELAPDITDEDIDSWVDLLEVPIDVALKVTRVEGMREVRQALWRKGISDFDGRTVESIIDKLIEAENDSLDA